MHYPNMIKGLHLPPNLAGSKNEKASRKEVVTLFCKQLREEMRDVNGKLGKGRKMHVVHECPRRDLC